MINIIEKKKCCGCNACKQCCPNSSISVIEDNEGFLYPIVNINSCTNCGLCEKVCPIIVKGVERIPIHVYASKNRNEIIRIQSSSGGIFSSLAEKVLEEGGVVFGAMFNKKWEVFHDYIETKEKLHLLRGSKYVQSNIGDSYSKTMDFLKIGKIVLFSGTPCQILGLKLFLKKEFVNLLTIDILCHGVPSPMVWRRYLLDKTKNINEIENINFRNKIQSGWKNYCFSITMKQSKKSIIEPHLKNDWMNGFLHHVYIRPSCSSCPAKSFSSKSDISIGDYWGIQNILPKFDDDKGVSLVFVLSEKGNEFFSKIKAETIETNYQDALIGNPIIIKSINLHPKRNNFYKSLQKSPNTVSVIRKYSKLPLRDRYRSSLIKVLVKMKIINFILKIANKKRIR